jgi:toxin YoeB
MEKYYIDVSDEAKKHLKRHLKSGDKVTIKRIDRIFEELAEHPFYGIGKPEALKGNFLGAWSRRLNKKDRIIYEVNENIVTVFIISAKGHY